MPEESEAVLVAVALTVFHHQRLFHHAAFLVFTLGALTQRHGPNGLNGLNKLSQPLCSLSPLSLTQELN